jgi:hypothetical protein
MPDRIKPDTWREFVSANGIVDPITDEHVERFADHLWAQFDRRITELEAEKAALTKQTWELGTRGDEAIEKCDKLKARLRETAQLLRDGFACPTTGPMDAQEFAALAVRCAEELREENEQLRENTAALSRAIASYGSISDEVEQLKARLSRGVFVRELSGPTFQRIWGAHFDAGNGVFDHQPYGEACIAEATKLPDGAQRFTQPISAAGVLGPGVFHVVFVPEATGG